jgi:hypothetical protein
MSSFREMNCRESFLHLLNACETFAGSKGVKTIEAGMNLGRTEAYRDILSYGFRSNSKALRCKDLIMLDTIDPTSSRLMIGDRNLWNITPLSSPYGSRTGALDLSPKIGSLGSGIKVSN